jgi:hypothetical protein
MGTGRRRQAASETPEQVQVLAYALNVEWDAMVEIVALCGDAWVKGSRYS